MTPSVPLLASLLALAPAAAAAAAPAARPAAPTFVFTVTTGRMSDSDVSQRSLDTLVYLTQDYACDVKTRTAKTDPTAPKGPGSTTIRFACSGPDVDAIQKILLLSELRDIWGEKVEAYIDEGDAPPPPQNKPVGKDVLGDFIKKNKLDAPAPPLPKAPPAPKGVPLPAPAPRQGASGGTGVFMVARKTAKLRPDGKHVYDKVNACREFSPQICSVYRKAFGRPIDLHTFYVAKAIINRESVWYPSEEGDHGQSFGLMQVQLNTARAFGFTGSGEELKNPVTNLHYGLVYLDDCLRQANRAVKKITFAPFRLVELMLGAYNAGRPKVARGNLVSTHGYHREVAKMADELGRACGYRSIQEACR